MLQPVIGDTIYVTNEPALRFRIVGVTSKGKMLLRSMKWDDATTFISLYGLDLKGSRYRVELGAALEDDPHEP